MYGSIHELCKAGIACCGNCLIFYRYVAKTGGLIPLTLGGIGIVICGIWVFATAQFSGPQDFAMAIFAAFTQGILVTGASTYVHQLIKQAQKEE